MRVVSSEAFVVFVRRHCLSLGGLALLACGASDDDVASGDVGGHAGAAGAAGARAGQGGVASAGGPGGSATAGTAGAQAGAGAATGGTAGSAAGAAGVAGSAGNAGNAAGSAGNAAGAAGNAGVAGNAAGAAGSAGFGGEPGKACQNAEECGAPDALVCDPQAGVCVGASCGAGKPCVDGRNCHSQIPGQEAGVCVGACGAGKACGAGEGCVPAYGAQRGDCLPVGAASAGQACVPNDVSTSCAAGSFCLNRGAGPVCTTSCDPFAASPGCPGGELCAIYGFCVSKSFVAARAIGEKCDDSQPTAICGADAQAARGTCHVEATQAICRKNCRVQGADCAADEVCQPPAPGFDVGVCAPDTTGQACQNAADCGDVSKFICDPSSATCSGTGLCDGQTMPCKAGDACVLQAKGAQLGACYPGCTPFQAPPATTSCAVGMECLAFLDAAAGYCQHPGPAAVGQPCAPSALSSGCVAGARCYGTPGVCQKACNPWTATPGCSAGHTCIADGVCAADATLDPASFGQPCVAEGAFCGASGGSAQGLCFVAGPGAPVTCLELCRAAGDDCSTGTCQNLFQLGTVGGCM